MNTKTLYSFLGVSMQFEVLAYILYVKENYLIVLSLSKEISLIFTCFWFFVLKKYISIKLAF